MKLASRTGFEPVTYPLGGDRAIHLRHRDMVGILTKELSDHYLFLVSRTGYAAAHPCALPLVTLGVAGKACGLNLLSCKFMRDTIS